MVNRLYAPVKGAKAKPAKYGLINSETLVSDKSDHWGSGIGVDSFTCNVSAQNTEVCDPSHTHEIVIGEGYVINNYVPFTIQASYECSTMGFKSGEYFEKAITALELVQGKAVENEFWTGALAQQDESTDSQGNVGSPNRYLASIDATVVGPTGTAVSPVRGLAILEQAIADCGIGARGTIHATRQTGSALGKRLDKEDGVLYTDLGSLFVAGTGYPGTGPDGEDPGAELAWMYATGPVSVYLGDADPVPDLLKEAVNTSINSVAVTAEKPAAVVWDGCCHFAVLVDNSLED